MPARDPISHEPTPTGPRDTKNPEVQGASTITEEDYNFTPADYEDQVVHVERRTVLHGYGRLHPAKRHYIDEIEFVGGVARHVPLTTVERWLKAGNVRIKVLDDDADPIAYAKAIGLKPMNADKLAALLSAADYDQLIQALGLSRASQVLEELDKRIRAKRAR